MGSKALLRKLHNIREGLLDPSDIANTIIDIAHSDLINQDAVRRDLINLIAHEDCDVRSEAMGALAYHGVSFQWEINPGKKLLSDLLAVLDHDPESDCRRSAASALGSFFKGTHRREVIEALSEVCNKSDEKPEVRAFAYVAFLDVVGVAKNKQPSPINLEIGQNELSTLSEYLTKKRLGDPR